MSNLIQLDRTDRRILELMQANGRISNLELAERIGLSPSPCSRRVKALEDAGLIANHVTLLDANQLGLSLQAYIHISLDRHTPERFENFDAAIKDFSEVLECDLITGTDADYQLKVVVRDMEHYQQFLLGKLTRVNGVTGVRSSFVLRRIKHETALPLDHLG
ncbi:Lrp/AsnC family transcriptional regulator [Oceanisphaera avium]|uniref:AsnC family transcriptional regulator n=1 Tax=Oceanisphaera avium TaxID=1903694 RepID=A0A1Y0CZ72_9GAMM|nr:Lrp/AsnC family transcriptional regulator [Oceanisphaera avium]ART80623.1 AsnC family transcriptional regulator [Oceanisphaera avium]